MKKFFVDLAIFAAIFVFSCPSLNAAAIVPDKTAVAVMDFGKHIGAAADGIILTNADKTASDYIIEALVENGHYTVIDKELLNERLAAEGLNTSGLINPDHAKRIGEILGVRYIIYGNVNDVTGNSTKIEVVASGADVHTVKAHIIARMMDVTDGSIVMAAKGEGKSQSSLAKIGAGNIGYLTVGTKKISQVSVHNALKKAAYSMVDKLTERLYGIPAPKRK